MTEAAPPPPPVLPPQPPALALAIGHDLVTRYRLRLTDARDSRLGPLGDAYDLGAAGWTGPRAVYVGFYTPPADPALAGPDLAARCAAAARWGEERLRIQGATNAAILLVALAPIPGTLTAPPSNPAVHVGVIAVDPTSADVTVLLAPPRDLPGPRDVREHAQRLVRGEAAPTLAAVDLAERQAVAGGYAAPARQQLVSRPMVTYALIASFVAVFVVENVLLRTRGPQAGLYDLGILTYPLTDWWRVLSYAFLHEPISTSTGFGGLPLHIIFNSIAMYIVGRLVEQLYGRLAMLATFFVAAAGGGILFLLFNQVTGAQVGDSVLGASGGITGLLGLLAVLGRVQGTDVPVGIAHAMRSYALRYMAIIIVFGLVVSGSGGGNVSTVGHVGGFITGAAVGLVVPPLQRIGGGRPKRWQALLIYGLLGLAAITLLFAAVNAVTTLTGPDLPSLG